MPLSQIQIPVWASLRYKYVWTLFTVTDRARRTQDAEQDMTMILAEANSFRGVGMSYPDVVRAWPTTTAAMIDGGQRTKSQMVVEIAKSSTVDVVCI